MFEEIKLKFGSGPNTPNVTIPASPVTIFIGPNNSGKSIVLRDIHEFCINGAVMEEHKILEAVTLADFGPSKAQEELDAHTLAPAPGQRVYPGHMLFGDNRRFHEVPAHEMQRAFHSPNSNSNYFCQYYLAPKTLKLDGASRIHLVQEQILGDLQSVPQNDLASLFIDDNKRLEVRRIIYEAFDRYFVLDPTGTGKVRIRLSKTPPESHHLEKGLHTEAVEFHKNATQITEFSDGVKAFTGIIISIVAGKPKVTIIDEPEAFLHPSLSYKLGKEVANNVKVENKRLFVATHSSNFLMGCIQSGSPLNIVRLTYSNETPTARILVKDKIAHLMKDPLLRSTGVLDALFYDFVVVTEGDSDRAFYQEINERLNQFAANKGIPNCLFLNAQGKDTIWKIIKPLREMGIPAAAIYDIDILKNGGTVWSNTLGAGFVPPVTANSAGQARSQIKIKFDEAGKDMKRDGGVSALNYADQEASNNLLDELEKYGLFVLRHGEVEKWLGYLGVEANKSNWLPKIFEKMGSIPEAEDYVRPQEGDVWDFIYKIRLWMFDKNRKGIPN